MFERDRLYEKIVNIFLEPEKIILTGNGGMGKSWFKCTWCIAC